MYLFLFRIPEVKLSVCSGLPSSLVVKMVSALSFSELELCHGVTSVLLSSSASMLLHWLNHYMPLLVLHIMVAHACISCARQQKLSATE